MIKSCIGIDFKKYLCDYFTETEKLLKNTKTILISSDIIKKISITGSQRVGKLISKIDKGRK